MKKRLFISFLALVLSFAVILCGCTDNSNSEMPSLTEAVSSDPENNGYEKSFVFEVVDGNGQKTQTTIETNSEYVGIVLQELGLIKGEQGDYGLYIKEVNGITADFNVDGTYWAFYVDDAYAMASADLTPIVNGSTYSFRVEKG